MYQPYAGFKVTREHNANCTWKSSSFLYLHFCFSPPSLSAFWKNSALDDMLQDNTESRFFLVVNLHLPYEPCREQFGR